jgi:hypothetical protein
VTTATERTRGPGDLLADRYRLDDLLQESSGARFWLAHDLVLSRAVAVHVIDGTDARASGLLDAARRSAVLVDRRILRVLDADTRDGVCFVVTEWAEGTSLDVLLAEGPLAPERAAWICAELGAAISSAHAVGHAHGRLLPEGVLIDRSGTVRVMGFAVDAGLVGLPPGSIEGDVTDLAAILYAALTGRWPGRAPSERVPTAPAEAGQVLRARQVRAGVPAALDSLCEQVLGPEPSRWGYARTAHDLTTAAGITAALLDFLGDPAPIAQAEAVAALTRLTAAAAISLPPEVPRARPPSEEDGTAPRMLGTPDPGDTAERPAVAVANPELAPPPTATPVADPTPVSLPTIPQPAAPMDAVPPDAGHVDSNPIEADPVQAGPIEADPVQAGPVEAGPVEAGPVEAGPVEAGPIDAGRIDPEQTQAGVPIFLEDSAGGTEVSWFSPRSQTPPPPPPFEAAEPRPLFAPEQGTGGSHRRPVDPPGAVPPGEQPAGSQALEAGSHAGPSGSEFWPWASPHPTRVSPPQPEETPEPVPGRAWLRTAAIIATTLLLLLAIVAAYNMGRGRAPLGGEPEETTDSPSAPVTATGDALAIASVRDFDPQATPAQERPELVPLAFDGDPATAWRTEIYEQNFGPAGLKSGLGLIIDLGETRDVTMITVEFNAEGTSLALDVSAEPPADEADVTPVAEFEAVAETLRASLPTPVSGRFVTVWLTSLPTVTGGFRAEIAEVVVRG